MKGAIQTGLYGGARTIADIAPSCPGGNCTFKPYWSLAVCSSVADISSHLVQKTFNNTHYPYYPPTLRYYASTHQFIDGSPVYVFNVTSAGMNSTNRDGRLKFTDSVAFKDIDAPLADIIVLYLKGDSTAEGRNPHGAIEFVLEWCIQNFTTVVVDGVSTTQRHNSVRNFTIGSDQYAYVPSSNQSAGYGVQPPTHVTLQQYLRSILRGEVGEAIGLNQWYSNSDPAQALFQPFDNFTGDLAGPQRLSPLAGTKQTGIERIVGNIATEMTN